MVRQRNKLIKILGLSEGTNSISVSMKNAETTVKAIKFLLNLSVVKAHMIGITGTKTLNMAVIIKKVRER